MVIYLQNNCDLHLAMVEVDEVVVVVAVAVTMVVMKVVEEKGSGGAEYSYMSITSPAASLRQST